MEFKGEGDPDWDLLALVLRKPEFTEHAHCYSRQSLIIVSRSVNLRPNRDLECLALSAERRFARLVRVHLCSP
jgi:hypothetical protein